MNEVCCGKAPRTAAAGPARITAAAAVAEEAAADMRFLMTDSDFNLALIDLSLNLALAILIRAVFASSSESNVTNLVGREKFELNNGADDDTE